jgi:hypothetical protein
MGKRGPQMLQPVRAVVDYICEEIAAGRGLVSICQDKTGPIKVPDIKVVRRWLIQDAETFSAYTRARKEQAELYADQIIELGDAATPADCHVRRLQCDNRKWKAAKLDQKAWGDQAGGVTINNNVQVLVTEERRQELIERRQKLLNAEVVQPALPEPDTE